MPKRSVHLIGLNHKYQLGLDHLPGVPPISDLTAQDITQFCNFLLKTGQNYGIKGIAEEMNADALRKWGIRGESVPCTYASRMGFPHRYCEAPAQDSLKMTSDEREQYWLEQISDFKKFPLLFICGADHVSSFKSLLESSKFETNVVVQDWRPGS